MNCVSFSSNRDILKVQANNKLSCLNKCVQKLLKSEIGIKRRAQETRPPTRAYILYKRVSAISSAVSHFPAVKEKEEMEEKIAAA